MSSQSKPAAPPPGLNVHDILYVLFKHKWKIIVTSAMGIAAAAGIFFLYPVAYESQAKLLVRYVVDTSAIDQLDSRATASSGNENVINSEVEILTSWDLAIQVAGAVGPERLLPDSKVKPDLSTAAQAIRSGLLVIPPKRTSIIWVSYRNANPELATVVLKELVTRYFAKHLEVHRSADAFNFVTQQSDEIRARLNHTEDELKTLKTDAGITSVAQSITELDASLAKTREALQTSEAELAEKNASIQEMENTIARQVESLPAASPVEQHSDSIQQYHSLLDRLRQLRETEFGLLSKYLQKPDQFITDNVEGVRQMHDPSLPQKQDRPRGIAFVGNERDLAHALARERYRRQNDSGFAYQANKKNFDALVKEAEQEVLGQKNAAAQVAKESEDQLLKLSQMQIENLEKQRVDLEKRFPGIATSLPIASSSKNTQPDLSPTRARLAADRAQLEADRARLAGVQARTEALKSRLADLQKQAEKLSHIGPKIERLERTKEIEETNYKYFQASLEKARIDEALDPSKMPNISVVQSPSMAFRTSRDLKKVVLGLAGGGVALGLAFAFLMELVIDRSVKKKLELETLLGIPVLLSIPYLNGRAPLRLRWPFARNGSALALRNGRNASAPWDSEHFIRSYSEAIRDRLVLYFELNGMDHKPKLVAVTDCSVGAGASTLAGGIAAALSETGDGKVLLVDMNVGRPEIHPFFRGTPACSLTEALVGAPSPAGDNLYLAVASQPDAPQAPLIPKKFYDLMPHLKASDFDYIIFDMPPLGQTSITLPMSRFMDKVLIVAEAEKSNRDFIKRAYSELVACRASVSVILNKARSYTPKWLGAET